MDQINNAHRNIDRAFKPLLRVFLLDARFNRIEIAIDFVLPLVFLIGNNVALFLMPTGKLHTVIAASGGEQFVVGEILPYIIFILWTTVINLVISQAIQLREAGYLSWMSHMAGSVLPVFASLCVSQMIVATAEAVVLSLVAMVLLRMFLPSLLLAALVGSPVVIAVLSLLFSPILHLRVQMTTINALVTLLTIGLFSLPLTGSTPLLTALLGFNPIASCRTLLLLVAAPADGFIFPASPHLLALALAILISIAAGLFGLHQPALRPIIRR